MKRVILYLLAGFLVAVLVAGVVWLRPASPVSSGQLAPTDGLVVAVHGKARGANGAAGVSDPHRRKSR